MNTLLQPQIIAAGVGFLGVLLGVLISFLIARRQGQLELERLKKTLEAEYEKKLIERRLDAYSSLWKVVSVLSKETLSQKFTAGELPGHVAATLQQLKDWYAANGLTLSKNAYGRFTRLCGSLDAFLRLEKHNNKADLKPIRKRVWDLKQNLRADVQLERIEPRSQEQAKASRNA